MDPDDNRLQGLDLVKLKNGDAFFENEYEWTERKKVHDALENFTLLENKPSYKEYFEVAKQTTQGNLRCNLVIPIIKVRATIPEGHSDGSPFNMDEEYTYSLHLHHVQV